MGHVDQQGPAPRQVLGQDAAGNEADGQTAASDATPNAEGPGPLPGLGEGHRQQRQGGRSHDRGERALQGPGAEQEGGVGGQAPQGGSGAEAQQAGHQHPLAAQEVGDPPPEKEQTTERDGVGGDHPLPVGGRDVERLLGVGEQRC